MRWDLLVNLLFVKLMKTTNRFDLEKLKVTIPWNSLSNHPTEVQIDGFYLLIVPKNGSNIRLKKKSMGEFRFQRKVKIYPNIMPKK